MDVLHSITRYQFTNHARDKNMTHEAIRAARTNDSACAFFLCPTTQFSEQGFPERVVR